MMIVTTESGTKYKIDTKAKTWERISHTERSGELRSTSGEYYELQPIVVGLGMVLVCPHLTKEDQFRLIYTSNVVSVEEDIPENGQGD